MCISSQYPLLKCFSVSSHLSEGHTNNFSRISLVLPSMTNVNKLNMHMGGSTKRIHVSYCIWLFHDYFFPVIFFFFYSILSEDKSNSYLPVIFKTEHGQRDRSIISWKNYNSVIVAGRWLMTSLSCDNISWGWLMTSLSYDNLSRVWIYLAERDSNWSACPNPHWSENLLGPNKAKMWVEVTEYLTLQVDDDFGLHIFPLQHVLVCIEGDVNHLF